MDLDEDPTKYMEDHEIKSPWSKSISPEAWQDAPNYNRQLLQEHFDYEVITIKPEKLQCNNCKNCFNKKLDGLDHASSKSCIKKL